MTVEKNVFETNESLYDKIESIFYYLMHDKLYQKPVCLYIKFHHKILYKKYCLWIKHRSIWFEAYFWFFDILATLFLFLCMWVPFVIFYTSDGNANINQSISWILSM